MALSDSLCSDTARVDAIINQKPILVINDPASVCAPLRVNITIPAITNSSTKYGDSLAYFMNPNATIAFNTPTVSDSGSYYIMSVSDSLCRDTAAVNVTVNPKPVLSITNPSSVCEPLRINLTNTTVTNGSIYSDSLSYFTDANISTPYLTPVTADSGSYYILALSDSLCADTGRVETTVNPKPVLSITNPTPLCDPLRVDITEDSITDGTTFTNQLEYYTNEEATNNFNNAIAADSGTYYIIAISDSLCRDTASVHVIVNVTPNLKITDPLPVCFPEKVNISASEIRTGSTDEGANVYYTDSSLLSIVPIVTAVDSGYYMVVSTTIHSCADTAKINVIVNPKPILSITDPDSVCRPNTVDITDSLVTAGSHREGINSYFRDSNALIPFTLPTIADSATYYVVTTTPANCTDTMPINVTIMPKPSIDATGINPTKCSGSDGALIVKGLITGSNYFLSYNNKPETLLVADSSGHLIVNSLSRGSYTDILVTSHPGGCQDDHRGITLFDPSSPFIDAGTDQQICYNDSTKVKAITRGNSIITWDKNIKDDTLFLQDVEVVHYVVTIDSSNCIVKDSVKITMYPEVMGSIDTTIDCSYDEMSLSALENSDGLTTFTGWFKSENGTLFTTLDKPQSFSSNVIPATYLAQFTNPIGCFGVDTVTITKCAIQPVEIPNAITLNTDGENDFFWINKIWLYPDNELKIYNRWGSLVYKANGYINDWDGTRNGEQLPVATYYYILTLNDEDRNVFQGSVTLLRE